MKQMEKSLKRRAKKFAKRKGAGSKVSRGGLMARDKTGLTSFSREDNSRASSQMEDPGRAAAY